MTKPRVLVEACVESVDEVLAAARGGANRLELCANMDVGGTTPSAELFGAVRSATRLPIAMMVRPRGGPFFYSRQEIESMRRDIDAAVALGADLIVLGVLRDDNTVDVVRTREFVTRAGKTPVTFHMAFDAVPDQVVALDDLIGAGVSRVLTKGGTATALEGVDRLARLVERAGEHIEILAGGTVRGNNVREIVERSRVREVHARCNTDPARIREIVDALA